MALTHTLLPEPVAPAMRRCGILARSALNGWPATSCPSAKASFDFFVASPWMRLARTSFSVTRSKAEFGISIPTYGSPGIGASIRMLRAESASARLSERPSIRLSFTPGSTSRAYWVTTGPSWMRATFTPMPKCASVSRIRSPLAVRSSCAADDSGAFASRSIAGSSHTRSTGSRAASLLPLSPTSARWASSSAARSSSIAAAATASPATAIGTGTGGGGVRPLPFAPGAGRSRRTITGASSSASAPPMRSRHRSSSPGRAWLSAAGSGRASLGRALRAARCSASASRSCCSWRSARYAATRSPIVMLK